MGILPGDGLVSAVPGGRLAGVMPIIETRELTKRYPRPDNPAETFKAVDRLTLSVEAGEIYGTLLRILELAKSEGLPTHLAANKVAESRILEARHLHRTFVP